MHAKFDEPIIVRTTGIKTVFASVQLIRVFFFSQYAFALLGPAQPEDICDDSVLASLWSKFTTWDIGGLKSKRTSSIYRGDGNLKKKFYQYICSSRIATILQKIIKVNLRDNRSNIRLITFEVYNLKTSVLKRLRKDVRLLNLDIKLM